MKVRRHIRMLRSTKVSLNTSKIWNKLNEIESKLSKNNKVKKLESLNGKTKD